MSITLSVGGRKDGKFFMLFFTCHHKEIYSKISTSHTSNLYIEIQNILFLLTEINVKPLQANSGVGNNHFFSGVNQTEISKHGLVVKSQSCMVLT